VTGACAACCPFSVTTLLLTAAAAGMGQGKVALLWNMGREVRSVTGVPACGAGRTQTRDTTCQSRCRLFAALRLCRCQVPCALLLQLLLCAGSLTATWAAT
jgi:hypothetical protein